MLILPPTRPTWNGAYPWRIVLHSIEGTAMVFRYPPHGGLGGRSKTALQVKTFDRSAAALEHPSGTPPTNTAGALQFELEGFTSDALAVAAHWPRMADWPDDYVDFVAEQLAPVHRYFGIPVLATTRSWTRAGDRMTRDEWARFSGVCAHSHVPDQPSGHWDGTGFRIERYLDTVRAILGGAPPQHPPQQPPEDDMQRQVWITYIDGHDTKYVYDPDQHTKHVLTKAEYDEIHAQVAFRGGVVLERPATEAFVKSLRDV